MTDLTEQWKKGKLPEGVYYCNTGNNVEILFTWGKNYHQLTNNKDEVYILEMDDCEIIAPVPSYEEWQASEKYNKHLEEVIKIYERKDKQATETSIAYNELLEENTKLRGLLKESREPLEVLAEKRDACDWYPEDLLAKLYQALGEDK